MKFQVLQENLEKAVGITSRFASPKAQLPILGNILISVKKSKILISSTNLELSACVKIGAKVEEEGDISIPAKVISEIISNLPKSTIDLNSEKEQLKISSEGFSSTVLGIDPTDFPKVPSSLSDKNNTSISRDVIVNALSKVSFATSVDETRPILTGVLFIIKGKTFSLVATDGFRLSRKTLELDTPIKEEYSFIVPKGILGEISRGVFDSMDIHFCLQEKEKQIIFGVEDVILTSRLLEGEYPDYEKIIPKSSTVKILTDKEEFLRAIKLASIFARESANIIKIKILKDSIKISAESSSAGSQEAKVDAKVEKNTNEDFEIAFNYRFVEDFVHSVAGDEIKMEFNSVSSAGVFTDTSDPNYLHLIMPVKIQG